MNRLAILLALAMLPLALQAFAQQHVSFRETGISVQLPADWSPFTTWSLTENLPAAAYHHLQNQMTGQHLAVHREQCPDVARRLAWARGELASTQLDYRVDSLAPLSGQSAVTLEGSTGFVSMAARELVVFKSYAFFLARGELCYRVEVGGPEELFDASSATYQRLLDGLDLSE